MRISTASGILKPVIEVSKREYGYYALTLSTPDGEIPMELVSIVLNEKEANKLLFELNTALLHEEMTAGVTE